MKEADKGRTSSGFKLLALSSPCSEGKNLGPLLSADDCIDPSAPEVQRGPLFLVVAMAVIDGGDAGLYVTQDLGHDDASAVGDWSTGPHESPRRRSS